MIESSCLWVHTRIHTYRSDDTVVSPVHSNWTSTFSKSCEKRTWSSWTTTSWILCCSAGVTVFFCFLCLPFFIKCKGVCGSRKAKLLIDSIKESIITSFSHCLDMFSVFRSLIPFLLPLCSLHNILWRSVLRFHFTIQDILLNIIIYCFFYCTAFINRNGVPTVHPWSASTATTWPTVLWCSKQNSYIQYIHVTSLTTDNWFPGYLFGSSDLCNSQDHN